jgi:hypothetical protein
VLVGTWHTPASTISPNLMVDAGVERALKLGCGVC